MKKLITLAIAGCMVLGAFGSASAVDVKMSGNYRFAWGYLSNNTLVEANKSGTHQDRLRARQRMNIITEFIADENVSALLNIEVGDMTWGGAGAPLDTDQRDQLKVKRAHLDWTLPNTQLKTRYGLQGISLPSVVAGNPVMSGDVAGISLSNQFTPEFGLTAFWARPFDTNNYNTESQNLIDEMDMFGVMLPIKTSAVRATPWAMLAMIGQNSGYYGGANGIGVNKGSGVGRGRPAVNPALMDGTGYAWWAGTTFEIPALDPFFFEIDAMMGGLKNGDEDSDQFGYFISGDIGYKFSWGRLSAIGWYASGDDAADDRGGMPIVSDDDGFFMTNYGLQGKYSRGWDGALSINGIGMWGVGLQLADLSFVDKLKHTARFVIMGGTNDADAGTQFDALNGSFGYLYTSDRAYEINLRNTYQVTKELQVGLDLAYLWLDLGDDWANRDDTKGSLNATVGIMYSF